MQPRETSGVAWWVALSLAGACLALGWCAGWCGGARFSNPESAVTPSALAEEHPFAERIRTWDRNRTAQAAPALRAQPKDGDRKELIFTDENLRRIMDEWERIWFQDQPEPMTPFRTHGGII